jgi:SAM-dependent methyltransferase
MTFDGKFRSYFGAIVVPVLDNGNGTMSNVTHDWANATASLGGGLAVTVLRLQIRNRRVDVAKERLVEMAIANNCQWVLFIDDDTILPGDALMKMIKLWKSGDQYKIITGVYWSKSEPSVPLLFKGDLEGSFWDWTTQDLVEVDSAGAGCLFVDIEVFKKMKKPWLSCNYFFDVPRNTYDLTKWNLSDQLGQELVKGPNADKKTVEVLEHQLANIGETIQNAEKGEFDPNLLKNKEHDAATTEDLYFFKKAKEAGYKVWADCSIQCMHQDKKTGRVWGLTPDMPQAHPRYDGAIKAGNAVVLDLGCGDAQYFVPEGTPIRVDIDPEVKPDVVADVRFLPFEDCFADMVLASHVLEHISFQETVSTLKEWIRTLKIGGKLQIVLPNMKWASQKILEGGTKDEMDRAMWFYYSAQKGDLRSAYNDIHRAGFTAQSIKELLGQIDTLENVEVYTTEGNFGTWNDPEYLRNDDMGYNIVAIATKKRHDAPVSLKLPIAMQEEAKYHIGERALLVKSKDGLQETKTKKVNVKKSEQTKKGKEKAQKKEIIIKKNNEKNTQAKGNISKKNE